MGRTYKQLSLDDRCEIACLSANGSSVRQIAAHETIYRFIYAQLARPTDFNWRRYLPRAKSRRGYRGKKGGSPASFIEGRVSLANRPIEVADRSIPGHWEADLGQAVLTVHERTSRLLLGIRLASKVARGVARHLVRFFANMTQELRQTVTFNNGTEFVGHLALHRLSIETFFCDPHAPWQKGGIENAIGGMRRLIPRKTDLATLSTTRFRQCIAVYNNTPRKCLDYRTPASPLPVKCCTSSVNPPNWRRQDDRCVSSPIFLIECRRSGLRASANCPADTTFALRSRGASWAT
ncbi:hypothetical protein AS156_36365 [Bradyrhizobium macuxiense]|uniref:Integrase catalytic domain-containing protein n=1 Tax=Bradyrhizobium macuxiense TaxID=1755647 RepID=A0A109JZZ1_9BRAD|nr:IS30 family transposase [Bradyrhizobium macuxiense]KWV58271.1 hypothetical protein AS156_36365 [Bradyrhizobium macuxiense]